MTGFDNAPVVGPAPPPLLSYRDEDIWVLTKHLPGLGSLPLEGDEEILFFIGLLPGNADVTEIYLMLTDQPDGTQTAD